MDEQNLNNIDEPIEENKEEVKEKIPLTEGTEPHLEDSENLGYDKVDEEPFSYQPYGSVTPEVEMTSTDAPDTSYKKGIKVFALIMAVVILICCALTVGYYCGKSSVKNSSSVNFNVDLAAKPSNSDMLTAAQVYQKADNCIVGIMTYNKSYVSSASGVVYSEDGYIITNDHIYDDIAAAKFKVYMADGNIYSAEYVAGDTRSDIAVIKITDEVKLTPAVFGDPHELYVGEPVVAMGRPTGAETKNNLTGGYVSAHGRRSTATSSYTMRFIQTDTAINPGSSGGALLNMYGQVVGIASYKIAGAEYEGMGFAVPMDIAKSVADSLIKNGYVEGRAKLGISYSEVDAVTAEVYDMDMGLYVAGVDATSDLHGKVVEGDTIVEVNGTKITNADVMLDAIETAKPGDRITLTVLDEKGKTRTVTAELLADKGSSSYSTIVSDDKDNKDDKEDNYTEEFDFPFGE